MQPHWNLRTHPAFIMARGATVYTLEDLLLFLELLCGDGQYLEMFQIDFMPMRIEPFSDNATGHLKYIQVDVFPLYDRERGSCRDLFKFRSDGRVDRLHNDEHDYREADPIPVQQSYQDWQSGFQALAATFVSGLEAVVQWSQKQNRIIGQFIPKDSEEDGLEQQYHRSRPKTDEIPVV
jgi:hypothetical protein